uniref:Uncharacterized protein n=1 Tax=Caenorhabditis japonica TaxID=281687 RepID=A0A8R1DEI1_CAEJA
MKVDQMHFLLKIIIFEGSLLWIRDVARQRVKLCNSNRRVSPRFSFWRRVVVAAACTLPADSLFAVMLYLVYPDSFLPSTLFIINFSLVLLALLGINSKVSSMILPALVWKCVLLLFLLFLGCVSVDAYQVPGDLDAPIPAEPQQPAHRSMMVWKELAGKYPMLPFIAVACTIVLAIEARVFFSAWQKICCPAVANDEANLEKSPPPYNVCVRSTSSEKDLPSYEDAIKSRSNSLASTSQQPSSSSTRPSHSIYTIPDVKVHKPVTKMDVINL